MSKEIWNRNLPNLIRGFELSGYFGFSKIKLRNCSIKINYMLMDIYMHAYFFTVRKSSYPGLFSAAQTSKVSAIDINY